MEKQRQISQDVKTVVVYSGVGLAVAGGLIWGVYKLLQSMRKEAAENQSLYEGDPATYAKQLKMAFENDGWGGTDEAKIYEVFRKIPSKAMLEKVRLNYKDEYGSHLMADLKEELATKEYDEIIRMVTTKA